jgi:hypothetical protein
VPVPVGTYWFLSPTLSLPHLKKPRLSDAQYQLHIGCGGSGWFNSVWLFGARMNFQQPTAGEGCDRSVDRLDVGRREPGAGESGTRVPRSAGRTWSHQLLQPSIIVTLEVQVQAPLAERVTAADAVGL